MPAKLNVNSANDADASCSGQGRAERDPQYMCVVSTNLNVDRIMKAVTNE